MSGLNAHTCECHVRTTTTPPPEREEEEAEDDKVMDDETDSFMSWDGAMLSATISSRSCAIRGESTRVMGHVCVTFGALVVEFCLRGLLCRVSLRLCCASRSATTREATTAVALVHHLFPSPPSPMPSSYFWGNGPVMVMTTVSVWFSAVSPQTVRRSASRQWSCSVAVLACAVRAWKADWSSVCS